MARRADFWERKGGGIGASPWQRDTPAARDAMRVQIEEGATMTPPVLRWIDVKDVQLQSTGTAGGAKK